MELFGRILKNWLRSFMKGSGYWVPVIIGSVIGAFAACRNGIGFTEILIGILVGAVAAVVLQLAYTVICAAVFASKYAEFNVYGYTAERAQKFQAKLDAGKRLSLRDRLDYAETLMRINQPEKALEILNDVFDEVFDKKSHDPVIHTAYFYIYVMSQLRLGNSDAAEIMISGAEDFPELAKSDKKYRERSFFIYFPIIMTDIYAGQNDPDKLELGLKNLKDYYESEFFAENTNLEIYFLCLYSLKMYGQEEEFDRFYRELKQMLKNQKYAWDFLENYYLAEFKKAANGKLPFLD